MGATLKIESTKAKARFASLPAQAKTRDVAITRHGRIQAYVLSPERYAHLSSVDHAGADVMRKLDDEFDALVARMQSTTHTRISERLATEPLEAIIADAASSKPARKPRKGKKTA